MSATGDAGSSDFGLDSLPLSDGAAVEDWWGASETVRGQHPFECQALERYRQAQLLGVGGMGQVSAVTDVRLNRQVALKEVGEHQDGAPGLERRLAQEAWITAQLEHPGIVPVYDAGRGPSGRLFFTMRLIRGRSLAQALADGDLAQPTLLRHFLAVCQAMAYAHDVGVVHRDLKPANIMIGAFGETQVMDWGLARQISAPDGEKGDLVDAGWQVIPADQAVVTAVGTRVGTPAYMSPEQAKAETVGAPSDVWSLGAILHEIVTGEPLFAGRDSAEIYAALERGTIPSVETATHTVPPELAAIIGQALSTAPSARYPEAGALANDVAAYLDGRRVEAHAYSTWDLTRRFARAFRLPLLIASLALVGVAVVFGLSYSQTLSERDRAREAESEARAAQAATQQALDRATDAESETGKARARADAALAQRLILKANEAARQGFQPEAEVLVTAVLAQQESPVARGLLARYWDQARPDLLEPKVAPMCGVRAISRDGQRVICRDEGDVELWDVAAGTTGAPLWRIAIEAYSFQFLNDRVALSTNTIEREPTRVIDLDTGATLSTLPFSIHADRRCTSQSQALFEADKGWVLWTAADNALTRIPGPADAGCWMSADGRWAVALDRKSVRRSDPLMVPWLLDLEQQSARPLAGIDDATDLKGALNADGSAMAWMDKSGRLRVLRTDDGTPVWTAQVAAREVEEIQWAPRGDWLAVRDERNWVGVWDVARRSPVALMRRQAWAMRWVPNDQGPPTLRTFGGVIEDIVMPTTRGTATIVAPTEVKHLAVSRDGERLLTAGSQKIALFSKDGRPMGQHTQARPGLGIAAHFAGNGHDTAVFTFGFPPIWTTRAADGTTSDAEVEFMVRWLFSAGDGVLGVGFRGDAQYRPSDGSVQRIRLPKPELMMAAGASRNGQRFAFLSAYGALSWAQLSDGTLSQATLIATDPQLSSVAMNDSGSVIAAGSGDSVVVYDVASGRRLHELGPTPSIVMEVAVSDSGFIAAGTALGELLVWDASGRLRLSANGHTDEITGLSWGDGGAFLYSAAKDSLVIRWGLSHLDVEGPELAEQAKQTWGLTVQDALAADLRR